MKALMLLVLAGLSIAPADEPTGTVMLACDGMANILSTDLEEQHSVSVGIILNFTAKNITLMEGASKGLGWTYPIKIDKISELGLSFGSTDENAAEFMSGTVNRVTGDVGVYHKSNSGVTYYMLKCEPTQRMF